MELSFCPGGISQSQKQKQLEIQKQLDNANMHIRILGSLKF